MWVKMNVKTLGYGGFLTKGDKNDKKSRPYNGDCLCIGNIWKLLKINRFDNLPKVNGGLKWWSGFYIFSSLVFTMDVDYD